MGQRKPIIWMGSSRKDLREFPEAVRHDIGTALGIVQRGGHPGDAKMLKGYRGGSVLEICSDFDTDTYRAVYTVRFEHAIVVLHTFQKKSKRGREMTQHDKQLIQQRLREADLHYRDWLESKEGPNHGRKT